MVRVRRGAALLTVLCSAVVLAGCATSTTGAPTKSATPSPTLTSVAAAPGYDVSRLGQLRGQFPAGFVPTPPSDPTEITPQLLPTVGTVASYGRPFTVDPAPCRPLLKPVDGQVGANSLHVRGDEEGGWAISLGAVNPVTVSDAIPTAGCESFTYAVDRNDDSVNGAVDRLTAPAIDGATTIALRYDVDGSAKTEYSYAAILDGRVYVDVQARLAPDFPAEPVLSQLLVKAVAVVRGR